MRIVAICLAFFLTAEASASAECEDVRAHLDREARRARRYDLAWAITFGGLALAQGGLRAAEYSPLEEWSDDAAASLEVGIVKSSLGMVAHLVLPLKVERPSGDDCASAHRALKATAHHEKQAFWLNHIGGLLVNSGGLLYLGLVEDTWAEGLKSFALGYPLALLSVYTQPRASWHFTVTPAADSGAQVTLSGTF